MDIFGTSTLGTQQDRDDFAAFMDERRAKFRDMIDEAEITTEALVGSEAQAKANNLWQEWVG